MSWSSFFLFGVTPAAAAAFVWSVFGVLKLSEPLKASALEWLTNPKQAETLQSQYMAIRAQVLGELFSWKRARVIALVFVIWVVVLLFFFFFFAQLNINMLSALYFNTMLVRPLAFFLMAAAAYFFLWFAICIFDAITLRLPRFNNSLGRYICFLVVGYYAVAIVASFLATFGILVFGPRGDPSGVSTWVPWFWDALGTALANTIRDAFSPQDIAATLSSPWQLFQPFDEGDSGIELLMAAAGVGSVGISAMFVVSALGLTLLNVGYALGLSAMRADYFVREKYGISQDYILKEPVEYIGRISCCVAAVAVLLCGLLVSFLSAMAGSEP